MPIIDTMFKGDFTHRLLSEWPQRFGRYSGVALDALYEYLEQFSDDIAEPIEFDPIAFDCEFTICDGVDDLKQWIADCGENVEELMEDADCEDYTVDDIIDALPRNLGECVEHTDGDIVIVRNC